MFLTVLSVGLVWPLLALGPGWAWAARLQLDEAEKICVAVLGSLVAAYLVAFAIYAAGLPLWAYWVLPVWGLVGLASGRAALRAALRDRDARLLWTGQLLVMAWSLGCLGLVISYSGGNWIGDWYEHWQRARFFLEHWPLDAKFIGYAALTARPPLANLEVAAVLALTGTTFSRYQVAMTLFNALAFLPAALLARRFAAASPAAKPWTGAAAVALLPVLVMLNPAFAQNVTFAWTKLLTVFFVLTGLYFFLRARDPDAPRLAAPLCGLSLGAGMLAHYSAGPYLLLLGIGWWVREPRQWGARDFWRQTALLASVGGGLLMTWASWAFFQYGPQLTLASNSSAPIWRERSLFDLGACVKESLVPHFLRAGTMAIRDQASAWGYWRDWWFEVYQPSVLFLFGSVAWLVLLRTLFRRGRVASRWARSGWLLFLGGAVILGIAVAPADFAGVAHLCLQPLLLLGLAGLAAEWKNLETPWRILLLAGAAVDLALGLVLQFGAESLLAGGAGGRSSSVSEITETYSVYARMNLTAKTYGQLTFFGDEARACAPLLILLLAAILAFAVIRARRALRAPDRD